MHEKETCIKRRTDKENSYRRERERNTKVEEREEVKIYIK